MAGRKEVDGLKVVAQREQLRTQFDSQEPRGPARTWV